VQAELPLLVMVIGADDEAPVRELVTRRRTAELPDLGQLSLVGLALHDGSPVEHLRNNASKPSIQWTSLISTHTSVNKEGKENEGERERAYPTPQRSMLGPYLVIPMSSSGGRYHLVTTMFVYSLPPSGRGRAEGSRKTKVGDLEDAFVVDEQIRRLHVSVED
jgi:hypothetical protein